MFETTVVESRRKPRRFRRLWYLPLSIGAHAVFSVAILAQAVWDVAFPTRPPRQMQQYILIKEPPPPPPPPPKSDAPVAARPIPLPRELQGLAPTVIPDTIPEVVEEVSLPLVAGALDTALRSDGGVRGGVPGGVMLDSAPPPEPEGPLRVGGDVKAPVVIDGPSPDYPQKAVDARIDGKVVVECIIDTRGRVRHVALVSSSDPLFEQSAIEAVWKWKFEPGTLHGEPVETLFRLNVLFEMVKPRVRRAARAAPATPQ